MVDRGDPALTSRPPPPDISTIATTLCIAGPESQGANVAAQESASGRRVTDPRQSELLSRLLSRIPHNRVNPGAGRRTWPGPFLKQPGDRPDILFVVNVDWFFNSHRLHIAKAAIDAGLEVHVACGLTSAVEVERMRTAGLRVHELPLERGSSRILGEIRLLTALMVVLLRTRPRLVHAVTIKPVLYCGLVTRIFPRPAMVAAISGLGYVFESPDRTLTKRAVNFMYRLALRRARASVIFQNPDDRELFIRQRICRSSQAVLIRGSGVDLASYPVQPTRPIDAAPTYRIIMLARILRSKGVLDYRDAANLVTEKYQGTVQFDVAGKMDPDNPESLSPDEWEAELDGSSLRWLGHVEDTPTLLRDYQIMVLPSKREGLPRALLEGAASRLALIATDVPGNREVVRPRIDGELVPFNSGHQLARCILDLLSSPEKIVEYGANARDRAEEEFSTEKVQQQTLDIYRDLGVLEWPA